MSERDLLPNPGEEGTAPSDLPEEQARLLAALAHASVLLSLVSVVGGLLVSGGLWLLFKDRAPTVRRHSAQAFLYQAAGLAVLTLLWGGVGILWTAVGALSALLVGVCLIPPVLGFSILVGLLHLAYLLYPCWGAWKVWQGEPFAYPWVETWVTP